MTVHLGDEARALQANAGGGSTDSAYAAAGFAEGMFDLFACEGRHDGADSLWANGSGSNFCGRRNHGGCGFKFGGGDAEHAARREDDGALDDVLQLPDVAGPVVAHQGAHGVGGEWFYELCHAAAGEFREREDERTEGLRARAEGRGAGRE